MKLLLPALLLLVVGCSGQPVENHYYLLRNDTPLDSRELKPSTEYAIGNVKIAPYIDQPGLVLEVGTGEIRPAMRHQWAEPMHDSVRNFLLVEISRRLGEDVFPAEISSAETELDIRISQLHGTQDGEVILSGLWMLRRGNEIVNSYSFRQTRQQVGDGYAAMAAAQEALLEELAKSIVKSMQAASAG